MAARDLLDHQAAQPGTIVPGRWLLDLEHESTIVHVRRYASLPLEADAEAIPAAESSSDASRRAAARLKVPDMLDAAWRAVNADGGYEGQGAVRDVMKSPCAIIVASRQGDGAMRRELWIFETGQQDDVDRVESGHNALGGLQRECHLVCVQQRFETEQQEYRTRRLHSPSPTCSPARFTVQQQHAPKA
jgi:hypothetical protein